MKIQKEYIFLALALVVLTGYLFAKKTNRLHYTLPTPPVIAKDAIVRLEIANGGRTTVLVKKDGAWFLSPDNYPVDPGKIDRLTATVAGLTLSALASESGDLFRYDLTDDKKITVQAFGEKGNQFTFSVGKRAPTNRHTFVALEGDKRVFQAQGNFRYEVEQSAQDLRDKKVFAVRQDAVNTVQIAEGGKTVELKRQTAGQDPKAAQAPSPAKPEAPAVGKPQVRWLDNNGKEIPEPIMNELFSQLSDLQCDSYPEGKKKEDFTNPILTVTVNGEKSDTLSIFDKPDPKAKENPGVSSTNGYPFLLNSYKVELIRKAVQQIRGEKTAAATISESGIRPADGGATLMQPAPIIPAAKKAALQGASEK